MRLPSPQKQSKGHLRRLLHQLAASCYLLSSQCRWLCLLLQRERVVFDQGEQIINGVGLRVAHG